MGASDDKILERAIIAVTRLQSKARGLQAVRRSAQLKRNSDARRLMELMGVPALAPTRSTQAEVPPTPLDSPRVAVPTPDARPPVQPATYVMPPLPPGPPPLPPGPPPQPSQLVQPPLPLSAPPHYSMPAVPPPVPPPMPPPVPAASQSMHSAAMLSVPAATPQKLDFTGLGQPGSCSMNSPACATELQSPQTHWTTRQQSRLHPADMTAPNGMSLSPLQRMSAAVMHTVELSPQERLLTAVVMQRFCRWGEHRTIGDWPAELRAYGPLPAIHDALRASRTRSLTLPQLVTAIKERTGGCAGGKALDMLNLKAYIRCFPETFHMRSGRTAAGRPLDLVVLGRDGAPADCLGDDAEDMGALAASAGRRRPGQDVNAPYGLASAGAPMPPHLAASAQSFAARPAAASSQSVPIKLQPKELFSGPTGAQPLWGNALGGFSLFGEHAGSPSRTDDKENASIEAGAIGLESPRSPSSRAACATLAGSSQHAAPSHLKLDSDPADEPRAQPEDTMLYQIKGLFVDGEHEAPADAVEQEQRRKYIEAHDLDRLFLQAVDRAREQSAASPAEFVGLELARLASCQHTIFEAEPRDPAELRHCALSY